MKSSVNGASSIRSLLSRSISVKQKSLSRNPKFRKSQAENTPPVDPNIAMSDIEFATPKPQEISRSDGLDGAPIESLPVKKDTAVSDNQSEELACQDPPVKVVVRIRPTSNHVIGGNRILREISEDSLSVGDRKFTFDSVLDSRSNQEDIFEVVGVPLLKNALAGYNTTILSYGQSGSGKTYTLWGPPSSMVDEPSSSSEQGLVPRIFEMLFSKIERERENCEGKQMNYQCRCSFLEIYNEKIGDLLDPLQRNLQIKDDPKNGLYVDNLSEEYVTSYEDVTQILIKGLSSRKVGATTVNSKSSRSHIVFTCIIESWCKESSSKCFNSSKISRISFVDLAGLDPNKVDDASRQSTREAKNVKKSLSHLGRLVNALAKRSKVAEEDVPYKSSCLTHLLRESFGGNAKLTVICAIPSDKKNDGELLSTLRFGQRVKYIKNNPVINEITEEDVNDLSDQIRQLKDELIRAKSHTHKSIGSGQGLDKRYARVSLNQLRLSLNRSLLLPHAENLEEVNVDENDVKELRQQLDKLDSSEDLARDQSDVGTLTSVEGSFETDFSEDFTNCPEEFETEEIDSTMSFGGAASKGNTIFADALSDAGTDKSIDHNLRTSISVNTIRCSQILEGPMLSESPRIGKAHRKSLIISSSSVVASSADALKVSQDISEQNVRQSIRSSLRTSKLFPGQTESLAASLQRGLEIIDYHQRGNSGSQRSSVDFSFENLTLKPSPEVDKASDSIQALARESCSADRSSASLLCASCQRRRLDSNEVHDSLKTWNVDGAKSLDHQESQMMKGMANLAEALARVNELENICKEQEAKIKQLTCSVEQYKMEKGYYSTPEGSQGSRILCIEAPTAAESSVHEELKTEILSKNLDLSICNDALEDNCEVKEIQEEVKCKNEKEELLKEIHALRSKLESYPDTYPNKSIERLRSSILRRSLQLQKSSEQQDNEEELERERQRWMEMESEWISLTDELRVDIETNRQRAEKLELELRSEKNCTEELDDALHRSVLGHARMVEHYADLQEKYNELVGKHRAMMEGIAEVKRAAAKAGAKGHGSRFAKSLNAELSAMRVEREREREFLKKENLRLKNQLRDTAEAVHAAGELLVRLREAEQATSASEENLAKVEEENDKLRKKIEKIKRKHKMEMVTMKQYMAESRLPESALPPSYKEDYGAAQSSVSYVDDDQSWRAEFGAIYQDHF